MYYWKANSDDGAFYDESKKEFKTKKEAYEDMRIAVLEKMKWNTEYDEDFCDDTSINYIVKFSQDMIIHQSYSGIYTYKIYELTKYEVSFEYIVTVDAKDEYDASEKADELLNSGNYILHPYIRRVR